MLPLCADKLPLLPCAEQTSITSAPAQTRQTLQSSDQGIRGDARLMQGGGQEGGPPCAADRNASQAAIEEGGGSEGGG